MPSLLAGCPNSPNSRGTCAKIAPPLCTHCSNYVSTLLLYPHAAWIQARAERTSGFGMHRRALLTSRSDLHLFSRDVVAAAQTILGRRPNFSIEVRMYIFSREETSCFALGREDKRLLFSNRELLAFYSELLHYPPSWADARHFLETRSNTKYILLSRTLSKKKKKKNIPRVQNDASW